MNFFLKNKFLILALTTLLAFLTALYLNIGSMLIKYIGIDRIESVIKEKTSLELRFENLQLQTTKAFDVVVLFDHLSLDTANSKIVNIENAKLKIAILPLIFKKAHIKSVDLGHVEANILRAQNGQFEILDYLSKIDFKLDFKGAVVNTEQYLINFDDRHTASCGCLKGSNFYAKKTVFGKRIIFKTEGKILINGKTSDFKTDISLKTPVQKHFTSKDFDFNLKITNFELNELLPWVKEIYPSIENLEGTVEADIQTVKRQGSKLTIGNIKSNDFILKYNDSGKPSLVQAEGNLQDNFEIKFNKNDIKLSNVLKSLGIEVLLNGEIKNFNSGKPKGDINIEFIETQVASLIKLLPDYLEKEQNSIEKLKRYKVHGIINGNVQIKNNFKMPDIFGRLDFKDVYIISKKKDIPYAFGFCEFQKDKLFLKIKAYSITDQWVDIEGTAEFWGRQEGNFKVTSTDKNNLKNAYVILIPIRDIVGFELGPLPFMKIEGLGGIDITCRGTKKYGTIDGWFKFQDTKASIQGINAWLENASGRLVFKKDIMEFENWRAKLGNSDVEIKGFATMSGDVDMKFISQKLDFKKALEIAKTSELIKGFINCFDLIENAKGTINFLLALKGKSLEFDEASIVKKLKPQGKIEFNNSEVSISKIPVKNILGSIKYGENYELDLTGKLADGTFKIKGNTISGKKTDKADIYFSSDVISSNDLAVLLQANKSLKNFLEKVKFYLNCKVNITGNIAKNLQEIDLDKLKLDGYIKGINKPDSKITFQGGDVKLLNQTAEVNNLKIKFFNSPLTVKGKVVKILSNNIKEHLDISFENFKISDIKEILNSFNEASINKMTDNFSGYEGYLEGGFSFINGKFKGLINPQNVALFIKSKNAKVCLKSGNVKLSNNNVHLRAFNLLLDETPFYADVIIDDIIHKPFIKAKYSTNLNNQTMDKFLNTYLTAPVKINGELLLTGKLTGYTNNYTIENNLTLNAKDEIIYRGATFGEQDNKTEFKSSITFNKNNVKINKLNYVRYYTSQNNKTYPSPIMKTTGEIEFKKNDTILKDLQIKTFNPLSAKLFNIIFGKSVLKQGLFNCNLKLNGSINALKVVGDADFKNINIPLYDLKINNISLRANNDFINGILEGQLFDSDININTQIVNHLAAPITIKNFKISSNTMTLDNFINEFLRISEERRVQTEPSQDNQLTLHRGTFVLENGNLAVKNFKLYDVNVQNLTADFTQKTDNFLDVQNVSFDVGGGKIVSRGDFNFDTSELNLMSKIENCDANALASDFLGITGQIYGKMNGDIKFSGKNLSKSAGVKTIKSFVNFEVINGKMPKLGSLEYLLRAGNLYKSGILGFSLNNLIEVLTPYKTGEFSFIKGSLEVQEGAVDKLQVYSKGKNLSLYLEGSYKLLEKDADIALFGRLSQKVGSVLGAVGNTSINTLVNSIAYKKDSLIDNSEETLQKIKNIPDMEVSDSNPRFFAVRIKGDLNKDNYVKKFNWLN